MSDWHIPLSDLDFGREEFDAAERVLRSKWLSMGPEVNQLEAEFANLQKARHAIAVSNGTSGLHLGLLAIGVEPHDEVIQPALNFVATANMTVLCGASPIFADIVSLDEPTIDPEEVAGLITPRTRAVVVMHYGGNMCRMSELVALCRSRNVGLIEDACHAVGAAYVDGEQRVPHGVMAGSIGDMSAFSFFSNKNMVSGEGGVVVTDRDDLADRMRRLRSHGMTTLTWDRYKGHAPSYDVVLNGFNYRLDELRAAIARVQLAKLARNNQRRRELLELYRDGVQSLTGWSMPFADRIEYSAGHLMVVIAPAPKVRDKAVSALREARIQSSLHYPCIADFKAFKGLSPRNLNKTRDFSRRAITLPLYPTLNPSGIAHIIDILRGASI